MSILNESMYTLERDRQIQVGRAFQVSRLPHVRSKKEKRKLRRAYLEHLEQFKDEEKQIFQSDPESDDSMTAKRPRTRSEAGGGGRYVCEKRIKIGDWFPPYTSQSSWRSDQFVELSRNRKDIFRKPGEPIADEDESFENYSNPDELVDLQQLRPDERVEEPRRVLLNRKNGMPNGPPGILKKPRPRHFHVPEQSRLFKNNLVFFPFLGTKQVDASVRKFSSIPYRKGNTQQRYQQNITKVTTSRRRRYSRSRSRSPSSGGGRKRRKRDSDEDFELPANVAESDGLAIRRTTRHQQPVQSSSSHYYVNGASQRSIRRHPSPDVTYYGMSTSTTQRLAKAHAASHGGGGHRMAVHIDTPPRQSHGSSKVDESSHLSSTVLNQIAPPPGGVSA